jgi:transcriptional antiterminator NusG
MMMQHDKFEGKPIASRSGDSFEDKMRRIRIDLLSYAQHRAGDDSPWFAARVMSGREIAVKKALDEAHIEACVPMRKGPEYRRRGRVIPATLIPVMTSYVLVRFQPDDRACFPVRRDRTQ